MGIYVTWRTSVYSCVCILLNVRILERWSFIRDLSNTFQEYIKKIEKITPISMLHETEKNRVIDGTQYQIAAANMWHI